MLGYTIEEDLRQAEIENERFELKVRLAVVKYLLELQERGVITIDPVKVEREYPQIHSSMMGHCLPPADEE